MTDTDLIPSVKATYDSAKDGPQYTVTTWVEGDCIEFEKPISDPFLRHTVHVGWRHLLRNLTIRGLAVSVVVSGTRERMNDVLELDDQTLIRGRTRHAAFHSHINERLGDV